MSFTLGVTIGAFEIGSIISVFLMGIITLQAHVYYTSFQEDRWSFKVLVAVVWFLELVHTAGVSYEVYNKTVTLYGEPEKLTHFPVLGAVTAIGGFITLFVQGFFALRLYMVLPQPYSYIGVFCILLSVVRWVGSIYLASQAIKAPDIAGYETRLKWLISTLLAGGAAVDMVISVSMLYYLSRKRGNALERATRLIDYLIIYTIRTGVLTSVSAVITVICFQTMPSNFIWLASYIILAKLYTNSLYSSLNSRKDMRQSVQDSFSVEFTRSRRSAPINAFRPAQSAPISIEMRTTTEEIQDGGTFHEKSGTLPIPLPSHPTRHSPC